MSRPDQDKLYSASFGARTRNCVYDVLEDCMYAAAANLYQMQKTPLIQIHHVLSGGAHCRLS